MNLNQIREVISLMNENNLSEIEIEKEGMRIRIKKTSTASSPEVELSDREQRPSVVSLSPAGTSVSRPGQIEVQKPVQPEKVEGLIVVKSPMVGTFYRVPSPDAPPFVEIGQKIETGQVLCFIEAMKLMNEIKSEAKGVVKEILVENGEPVEFGQELFILQVT